VNARETADLVKTLQYEQVSFADLTGTLYTLRFTGPITLHFLNGQPQLVELGQPVRHYFPEHPANARAPAPLDTPPPSPPSSRP
jgi:hypothetical protein